MHLPIEVSHIRPLKFKWSRKTDTPTGPTTVVYNSAVHPTLEGSLLALINLVKKQEKENDTLHREIDKLKAELAAKKNDKVLPTPVIQVEQPKQPLKKSK